LGKQEWHSYVRIHAFLEVPYLLFAFFYSTFKGFVSQTTRAHRLCQKAYQLGGQDLQIPLVNAIYKAHMEDGQDIAEIAVLADIAGNAGTMSREEVNPII
jgi:predicted DsbA family dithiol-disulfide isomerase